MAFTFLTAEWRNLIFANYAIDPEVLKPLVPYGTELDAYNGICYGSLVGFYFQRVRLFGAVAVPFHQEFEEFNLRFYVRRKHQTGWQRGVVFVKEIVPKLAISLMANTLYGEPYATYPMKHEWRTDTDQQYIRYDWKVNGAWNHIQVRADQTGHALVPDSEEAFITEHYWGYTNRSSSGTKAGRTSEYEVVHPAWSIVPVTDYSIHCDVATLYGKRFTPFFEEPPRSIFLADGSAVAIRSGETINR